MLDCTCLLHTPQATVAMARALAAHLRPGHVILLSGGIGAGKTHFARSLIQSILHVPEDVPSPTFTLVQTYDTTRGEVWHADLYRLTDPDELHELGLAEAFDTAICLVEWPDRMGSDAPENALSLSFEVVPDDIRRLIMRGPADPWRAIVDAVRSAKGFDC